MIRYNKNQSQLLLALVVLLALVGNLYECNNGPSVFFAAAQKEDKEDKEDDEDEESPTYSPTDMPSGDSMDFNETMVNETMSGSTDEMECTCDAMGAISCMDKEDQSMCYCSDGDVVCTDEVIATPIAPPPTPIVEPPAPDTVEMTPTSSPTDAAPLEPDMGEDETAIAKTAAGTITKDNYAAVIVAMTISAVAGLYAVSAVTWN